jgi:transposase
LNQLSALLVTAPDQLRRRLGTLSGDRIARAAARLRPSQEVSIGVLRRLGRRAGRLAREVAEARKRSCRRRTRTEPARGMRRRAGLRRATARLKRRSRPNEERSLLRGSAGASPIDASSGKQQRHRLNRGGDRQLNWALHVVALHRIRHHTETSTYYERLLATGKTSREARRASSAHSPATSTAAYASSQAALDTIEASGPT